MRVRTTSLSTSKCTDWICEAIWAHAPSRQPVGQKCKVSQCASRLLHRSACALLATDYVKSLGQLPSARYERTDDIMTLHGIMTSDIALGAISVPAMGAVFTRYASTGINDLETALLMTRLKMRTPKTAPLVLESFHGCHGKNQNVGQLSLVVSEAKGNQRAWLPYYS